jgi:hypothetical protein
MSVCMLKAMKVRGRAERAGRATKSLN